MKIIKLTAENVKRLTAIEITPEGTLITVGGKNGAGKSSVLDSIAYALGGKDLVPSQPIRGEEKEAKIIVDLGDFIVTRRFYRERVQDVPGASDARMVWGETKSSLIVRNKEGASYPSPQAILDKLLGKLTFDPLQFARDDGKKQNETLRKLVGLDTSKFDNDRKAAYDRRTLLKKQLQEAEIKFSSISSSFDSKTPEQEISMDEVSQEMLRAEELRRVADDADRSYRMHQEEVERFERELQKSLGILQELEKRIQDERLKIGTLESTLTVERKGCKAKEAVAIEAKAAIPDMESIRTRLTEIEGVNAAVRQNQKIKTARANADKLVQQVGEETKKVSEAEQGKLDALAAVKFPVSGLGFSEEGVTFNGVPFDQASNAEQIRVSVAIGLALNPTLKILLIRNGNTLDKASLKAVVEQATEADAQLWMEWVAESKDGVAVMLEDGTIV